MGINYIGEHLLAGNLGRIAVSLSFISALLAAVFYSIAALRGDSGRLRKTARGFFYAHSGLLLFAMVALYSLIFAHAFEYQYVSQYSSHNLPLAYLISSFWAGQEGSFMLWAFFQVLLGIILLRKSGDWEPYLISIISLSQAFLISMVLGWNLAGVTLGSDPFLLMRNAAANLANPFFQRPDYAQLLEGQGLNPLLENIWMAIHPPLLFLGYAAVLIPFAFAVGGLWRKDHVSWRNQALAWLNFAGLTLGIGIILGGAWAYVSLTFGGFWAWDPVENASLVPWLFIIATTHVLLISRKKPHNLIWFYLFAILSYFFVLYASYLTRSGVLKDSSAHAFGDEGKAISLIIFMIVFLVIGLMFLITHYPSREKKTNEDASSREFWVFVGALVLALSSFQIILTTSIPVINKIFGTNLAPPADAVSFYNSWQLPYAILIALLAGFSQYVKYGGTPIPELLKKLILPLASSLVVTVLFVFVYPFSNSLHYVFLFFLIFMMYSSIEGLLNRKKKQKNLGALLAHLGMSIFLFGVLITFSHTRVITNITANTSLESQKAAEYQILMRDEPVSMDQYQAIYKDRTEKANWLHYTVEFLKKDQNGQNVKVFDLKPSINRNEKMGNVHEPDTRHLLTKDIYGYITYAQNIGYGAIPGFTVKKEFQLGLEQSVEVENVTIYLDSISINALDAKLSHVNIQARFFTIEGSDSTEHWIQYNIDDQKITRIDDTLVSKTWIFRFNQIAPAADKIVLDIYEKGTDYIVMKVTIFPFIGVMWIGTILVFIGILLALWKRMTTKKFRVVQAETLSENPEAFDPVP